MRILQQCTLCVFCECTNKTDTNRKPRRKRDGEKNVVKAEDVEGYRGNTQDLDSLLQFIGGEETEKKSKKANKVAEKNTKKSSKKKEKREEKDLVKPAVTQKFPIDTVKNDPVGKGVENEPDVEKVSSGLSYNWSTRMIFASSGRLRQSYRQKEPRPTWERGGREADSASTKEHIREMSRRQTRGGLQQATC